VNRPTLISNNSVSESHGRSLGDVDDDYTGRPLKTPSTGLRSAPTVYVDDLFAEITALPPRVREQAIRERCADNPETERLIRAMLRTESGTGSMPPRRGADRFRLVHGETLGR
jgi:hypothetical protein